QLEAPRAIWLMVPAGSPVDDQIAALVPLLDKGDIIIDGGNSRYTDTISRHDNLKEQGIHFLDAGTSGGVWGLQVGYCLMVGGPDEAVKVVEPAFKSLAPEGGYLHIGPSGSGHFVKMIHNGIEYGMMQAYAEGFEILEKSRYDIDLRAVADLWMHGSVVRSWLLELAELAFAEDPHLDSIKGYVNDSGEGRWTVFESIDLDVAAPTIYMALAMRFLSRQEDTFANKVLAALRNQFGGHAVVRE
ncbi:MAG: decarboxylating 6-phosphogluconate dehydrogenase, partial [Thermomicrobiales bacterium]